MIKFLKMDKFRKPCLEYIRQQFFVSFRLKYSDNSILSDVHFRHKDLPCVINPRDETQPSPVPRLHILTPAAAVPDKDDKNSKTLNFSQ